MTKATAEEIINPQATAVIRFPKNKTRVCSTDGEFKNPEISRTLRLILQRKRRIGLGAFLYQGLEEGASIDVEHSMVLSILDNQR